MLKRSRQERIPSFSLLTDKALIDFKPDLDFVDLSAKYRVFPLRFFLENGRKRMLLAMKNPFDVEAIRNCEFRAGVPVVPVQARERDIAWLIRTYYFHEKLRMDYFEAEMSTETLSEEQAEVTQDVFQQLAITGLPTRRS